MKLVETSRFKKLRKRIVSVHEKAALKKAVAKITDDPEAGKFLKGEFRDLKSFRYSVKGQSKSLIYITDKTTIILFSFGPREGIYKHLNTPSTEARTKRSPARRQ